MEAKAIQQALLDLYEDLITAGKIKTKGEFAQLMGVGRNSLSLAMNGNERALTDSLMLKARALRRRELGEAPAVSSHAPVESAEGPDGIFIPRETLTLYESLARTAENLSALVSRLMPGSLPETQGKKSIYPEP